MSMKDIPITRNCDILNVAGRSIIKKTANPIVAGQQGDTVSHWQPFQIRGRRVTPCRVFFDDAPLDTYLPTINGYPMDDPRAILPTSCDVYLNVKFTIDGFNNFIIDSSTPPLISATSNGNSLSNTLSISTGVVTLTGTGWYSWQIGSIDAAARGDSYLRYFSGSQAFDFDDFTESIYQKGVNWGSVGISIFTRSEVDLDPFPNPYEGPEEFGNLNALMAYGVEPYSWGSAQGISGSPWILFNALSLQIFDT